MDEPPYDDRAPVARAIGQASQVTTIAIMMVLPALPGYWLDRYLNTVPLFAIIGLGLGMTAGIWQLIKFVNRPESDQSQGQADHSDESSSQNHTEES